MDAKKQTPAQQTFNRRVAALGAGVGAAAMSAQVFALDVAGATTGSTANTDINTAATWALGIIVLIYAAKKVMGFFGR